MTECVAILQARVSSSRLPGKVLLPVLGQPMLMRQIERLRRSRRISKLVVATSTDASDDPLATACAEAGVACHRGSLDDVLDRFHGAAQANPAATVIRLTGDCPLTDPAVIDHIVDAFVASGCDYASNTIRPTYPDGIDAEVLRYSVLERTWREAKLPSEREHVTPYVYKHPEIFGLHSVENATDLSALRWTVDTAEDLEFVRAVYAELYPANPGFSMHDVLALLEGRPELAEVNGGRMRNEGYEKSLAKDQGNA